MGGKEGSSGGYVSVSGNAKKLYDPANAFCLIRNVVAQQRNNPQPNRQTEGSPKPSKNK